ncbi:MAG: DUF1501 domain-containing protein [Granulosicoccus sp.]
MKRRRFLQQILLGSGVPLLGLNRLALAGENSLTKRRLVLVELAGANDGLNTLVPFSNDDYHRLRPTVGLSKHDVHPVTDSLGMHTSLEPLMRLWERGELAWVQGLGYPKANRSHFKSIALWESAGDGRRQPQSNGWMTHAVEHQLARQVTDPHGISLSGDLSIFASESGRWLSTKSVNELLQQKPPAPSAIDSTSTNTLALLQQRLQTLDTTLTNLSLKLDSAQKRPAIPRFEGGGFGEQLRQVSTMIAAGLDTPVYRVSLGGFDTHKNQRARHQRLLKTLAVSLSSFSSALRDLGEWDNTLVMTYSEFGRRAGENRSGGTDHGTAAPHLLLGGSVAGGLYGGAPDLADLPDGDPLFTMDYRALYHSMLVDGLGAQSGSFTLDKFADQRLQGLVRTG